MSSQLGEALIPIRLTLDKLDEDSKTAREKLGDFVKSASKATVIGIGGAVAGGATALAGFGAAGVKAFVPFQEQMNEVFTLLPNLSQDAMAQMTDDVLKFSAKFGTLPEETVPALYQAISAGVPADNVFAFLETAQKAAVGGVTELETAVDGISSVVNAYGSDVLDAAQASDLMFTAVKLGKTDFTQLSQSLFNVIPTAAALGVEFGDVTAALAAMTAQGTPTSVATTQMRQLLVELSKAGSKTADVFTEAAGVSFKEFVAQGGNVQEALIILEQAAADSGVGISDLFGSVEAGNAALALTGSGAETFANNLAEMTAATGASETAFEGMDQGLGRSMEKLKSFGQTVLIETGQSLSPMIDTLVGLAEEYMPQIQEAFERAQPIFKAFAEEFSAKLGPAIEIVNDALTRIFNALGVTNEEVSIMDVAMAVLKTTLDLIITALEAVAVTAHLVADAVEAVSGWVQTVSADFEAWKAKLGEMELPDWLTPGSPTPLELGLRGITDAMNHLPEIGAAFDMGAGAIADGGGGGGNTTIINIDGVSASSQGDVEDVIALVVDMLRTQLRRK